LGVGLTPEQIESGAAKAGFQRLPVADPIRLLFTRGPNLLNVHTDGKWAFYAKVVHGKKPDRFGSDFESLLAFLASAKAEVS